MDGIDWAWVIPKLIFVLTIVGAAILSSVGISRSSQEIRGRQFSKYTFILLVIWLTTDAIDVVVNRFQNPIPQAIHKALETKRLQGQAEIEVREDRDNVFIAVGNSIDSAEQSVYIISWKALGPKTQTAKTSGFFQRVKRRMSDESRPPIVLRRLFWKPVHLQVAREWADAYSPCTNIEIKYFDPSKHSDLPIMPGVIIDKKIVHFGMGYLGAPESDEIDILIKDSKVAAAFERYFSYLWTRGTYLKRRAQPVDIPAIERLEHQLGITD